MWDIFHMPKCCHVLETWTLARTDSEHKPSERKGYPLHCQDAWLLSSIDRSVLTACKRASFVNKRSAVAYPICFSLLTFVFLYQFPIIYKTLPPKKKKWQMCQTIQSDTTRQSSMYIIYLFLTFFLNIYVSCYNMALLIFTVLLPMAQNVFGVQKPFISNYVAQNVFDNWYCSPHVDNIFWPWN